jgi:hypothetical protein
METVYDTAAHRPGMLDLEGAWFAWRWWQRNVTRTRWRSRSTAVARRADGYAAYVVNTVARLHAEAQVNVKELIAATPQATRPGASCSTSTW